MGVGVGFRDKDRREVYLLDTQGRYHVQTLCRSLELTTLPPLGGEGTKGRGIRKTPALQEGGCVPLGTFRSVLPRSIPVP